MTSEHEWNDYLDEKKQIIANAVYTSRDKLTRDGEKNATLNRFNMIKFCHKKKNGRIHRQIPVSKKKKKKKLLWKWIISLR